MIAAYLSARRRPDDWTTAPVRLDLEQKARLKQRIATDFAKTGHRFAMNHYLTAALQAIPDDINEAVTWGEQYLEELGMDTPRTEGTATRLPRALAERMRTLTTVMPLTARYGLVGYVQMAALQRLLTALDNDDEAAGA